MSDESRIDTGYGAVAVAVAAIAVYFVALHNGFALDDVVVVQNDARVIHTQIGALLTKTYWNDASLALYRPLTSVSFALDWYLSQGSAAWFHFTNILWHALASVLGYLLLTRFTRPAAAMLGGLVFALHPVHVEAVANIVGRAELISATFFFAACLVWTEDDLHVWARALLTSLCYLLAAFAKESAIVLPAVLLLIDAARHRIDAGYVRRNLPALALGTLAVALVLGARWAVVHELGPSRVAPALELTHTAGQRIMTALQAWPQAARVLFFPRLLLADYDPQTMMPLTDWTPQAVLGLTILVALLVGGIVALVRGMTAWALALLWYPLTILIVSNLIVPIGVLLAERTLYLPSFALSIAVAAAANMPTRALANSSARVLAIAVMLALAVRTFTRIPAWQSTDSIMLTVARDRPNNFRGQWHLARMAREGGHVNAALGRYDRALRLWPFREGMVEEAAQYGTSHGRAQWARGVSLWGTRRWPGNVGFHRMLAANAVDLGDTLTARREVSAGLRIDPRDAVLNQMQRAFGSAQPTTPR